MTRTKRLQVVAAAMIGAVILSSCVLREGDNYVVQPASRGIHVTLRVGTTNALKSVSDAVDRGNAIDGLLAGNGYAVRCDALSDTRSGGDRCAFRVIQATKVEGNLAQRAASRLFWSAAVADGELSDFSNDGMSQVRAYGNSCLHVTIQNVGDWPIEWRAANWTYRKASDPKC